MCEDAPCCGCCGYAAFSYSYEYAIDDHYDSDGYY